jgi:hypothetical protein
MAAFILSTRSKLWVILIPIALLSLYFSLFFVRKSLKSRTKKMAISPDLLDPILKVEFSIEKSIKSFVKDLVDMLAIFRIPCKVTACTPSQSLTIIKLLTDSEHQALRITKLGSEIAKCMCADAVRIVNNKNRISLEIANQIRPKLQMKQVVLTPLFSVDKSITLPLGMDDKGRINFLNLKSIKKLAIVGNCNKNKSDLIHSWLISMMYQELNVLVTILSNDEKYKAYEKIQWIKLNNLNESEKPFFIVDALDDLSFREIQDLLNNKTRLVAVVRDINKCSEIIKEHFPQKILFKLNEGRRHLAHRQCGVESLLDNNDILYIDEQNISRFQTISISMNEIIRTTKVMRKVSL